MGLLEFPWKRQNSDPSPPQIMYRAWDPCQPTLGFQIESCWRRLRFSGQSSLMKPVLWSFLTLLAVSCCSAENWPQYRGPSGQGHSSEIHVPWQWSSDSNLVWKVQTGVDGWSSPIVWGNRVFLTGTRAAGASCHVLCLDAKSGSVIWDTHVFDQVTRRKEGKNSYATPTPTTDGERIYSVFGDGSMVAVDFKGSVVWTHRSVEFYSRHGLSSSPVVRDGILVMAYDGSNRVTAAGNFPNVSNDEKLGWQIPWDKAFVVGVDAKTGRELWRTPRGKSRVSHLTPLFVTEQGKTQVISCAGDAAQGFDLKTGARIWTAYNQGEGVTPNPALGDGLLFTSSGFEKTTLRAFKLGGEGDVSASHVAWEQRKGCPTQPALLHLKPHLHTITDGGIAHCYRATTGEILYSERVGGNFCTSPLYANGRIYFLAEDGVTTVVAEGPEFRILSRNSLNGERAQASMAVSEGKVFIRTEKTLWCIGNR